MLRKYGLPFLSLIGLLGAIIVVLLNSRISPPPPIIYPPPTSPYLHYVAASGIVEAASENIAIGSPFVALVTDVYVMAGAFVEQGDPLFKLDTRAFDAQKAEAVAQREIAIANFQRLLSQPRPEDVPPQEAQVRAAEAQWKNQQSQLILYQSVTDQRAISLNDLNQRIYSEQEARALFEEAQANLYLLNAGAWIMDLAIASRQVDENTAAIQTVQTNIDKCIVRAPLKGQVLQVHVHVGELADQMRQSELTEPLHPLMLFGTISPLHIRVDVDEEDSWKIHMGTPATAFIRGNSALHTPMEFVRYEPYVIPKRSLTGSTTERVDTRVLQLIYRFDKGNLPVYIGEIMDVYIQVGEGK